MWGVLTPEKLDPYELKIALFDNGNTEEFFLFIHNFNRTLEVSGIIEAGTNIQYHCILKRGEVLHQFDAFYFEAEGATPSTLEYNILGLGTYFFSVNALSKKRRAMHRQVMKPRGLKANCRAARLIELNEYLDVLPGENISDNVFMKDINDFF